MVNKLPSYLKVLGVRANISLREDLIHVGQSIRNKLPQITIDLFNSARAYTIHSRPVNALMRT